MTSPIMDEPLLQEDAVQTGKSSSNEHLPLPKHLEDLFLTMHYRKMQRELNGPQKKKTKYHFVALAALLVFVYGVSSSGWGDGSFVISLTLGHIVMISVWIFVAFVVTAIFQGTKFIILLYWLLIYWPLVSVLAAALFFGDNTWIVYSFVVVEVLTILVFMLSYYVYPRLVTSRRFLGRYGATRFWRIKLMSDGATMEYNGMWGCLGQRYQCHYVGETNDEGLPHGQGVWSDNYHTGEILTGNWEEGRPVAPFSSRQYGGTGNTFSAVRLAYFMATDDTFEANKLVPTNDEPPRCGVASVECSIAGHFMSHLPDALLVGDMQEGDAIGACCNELDSCSRISSEDAITSLQISTDSRGVQIGGHNFVQTGLPFTRQVKQIVVDVIKDNDEENVTERDSSYLRSDSIESSAGHSFRLDVRNWNKIETRDALIFLPGFNSWLKHSLETFGQLLAMTPKLSRHVYPVLFAWPGAQVLTYRKASFISASENNKKYFLQMLTSLQSRGITNVHIVSHSLGAQTLMNCFEDVCGEPSPVAQCFGPARLAGDNASSALNLGKLVCRSITMLNPDFPSHAFRERGFQSIRRVTSLITIVGDKADQALFWSSLINGLVNGCGRSQPSVLDFEDRCEQRGLQAPLGRNINLLYLDETKGKGGTLASQSEGGGDGKAWLDCDVIDTTGLDTNVNDLRHSAFNVNSILLRDIEELVVTGKRAADRTTLLHKRGNIYEFCHAPSFIKF